MSNPDHAAPLPQSPDGIPIYPDGTQPIAPAWHTLLLIAGILLLSFAGAKQFSAEHAAHVNRMQTYAFTVAAELVMLGWVYLGLRLRKIPFRAIFGEVSGGGRTLGIDLGSAAVFWFGAMVVLGTINATWTIADNVIHHRPLVPSGKPDPAQAQLLHTLTALAPSSATEIAAWIVLCVMAGIAEEVVFRGYLQRQFTAWGRGAIAVGVIFSALLFGCAHGYQGAHYMVLLSIFGALFSLLSIFRRNIRAGIFAHAWQDIIAGLALALLHSRNLI